MSPQLSLRQVKTAFLDLLLPLRCLGCGREGDLICPSCRQSLPRMRLPLCQRCGATVSEGNLCHSCVNNPPTIDGIRSIFIFQGTVRQAILQLKYKHLKAVAAPLSQLLAEYLGSHPLKGEVPVPLYPKRLRERGYNQASLLAKELGKLVGLPVEEDTLIRVKDSVPQARTRSAIERRQNVQDAFACNQSLEGEADTAHRRCLHHRRHVGRLRHSPQSSRREFRLGPHCSTGDVFFTKLKRASKYLQCNP